MRFASALGITTLLLVVGTSCAHRHRPSKGFVAREMECPRGALSLSDTFEDTWTGDDGVMRLRYRVAASCEKPKSSGTDAADVWQECHWEDDDWECGEWKAGKADGQSSGSKAAPTWLDRKERGR